MLHSVNIRKVKNGFVVSSYDPKTGADITTVHKNVNDAMKATKHMMGEKMTMTKKQKGEAKKMIAEHY